MNRKYSILRLKYGSPIFPYFIALTVCVVILFSLSSCKTGSKGRYKFQPESMHWLQFRGPNASGIAPEDADPPIIFSADTNILWKTPIISGWSSPCVVNDMIFLNGFNDSDSMLYTMAFDRETGEIQWQDAVKAQRYPDIHPVNSYASQTIASDGERIYSSFSRYGLIAYDLLGNKIWEFKKILSGNFYGGSSSPILLDSVVLTIIGAGNDPGLVALDCLTGEPVWTIRAMDQDWSRFNIKSTPVLWNDLLIMHLQWYLLAYDLVEKAPAWWLYVPNTGAASPVIMDNTIYVNSWIHMGEEKIRKSRLDFQDALREYDTNGNNRIECAELPDDKYWFHRPESPDAPMSKRKMNDPMIFNSFDTNKDKYLDENEWTKAWNMMELYMQKHGMYAISVDGHGERSRDDMIWIVNEDTPEVPSPLIAGNDVFFIKNGGIITVINRKTGKIVHKERISGSGTFLSSPLLAGNRIYTCSHNGTVSVLSADDYSVLASNKLKEKIGASPVAVDDVLYVRTDKHLYAFRDQ